VTQTYVLVHGGGFSGACWDEMRPYLAGPSHAVDLPGRGRTPGDLATLTLSDFADCVAAEILENDLSEVTLVGHSMAGLTLPVVAERVPTRLRHLVFVSCAVPPHGTSLLEVLGDLSPAANEVAGRLGDGIVDDMGTLHPDLATAMFCNDMNVEQVASTVARLTPESVNVLSEPADLTGLRRPIPRTYIRLRRDASISLEVQDRMIANLGEVQVLDLDAGHMAMISRPRDLADHINAL
jgi:pimeloyl-ACP methyl ester carboxylesterase